MTDQQTPNGVPEALCPACQLELTGSKKVETLRARRPDGGEQLAHVYFCPECGGFFEIPTGEPDH